LFPIWRGAVLYVLNNVLFKGPPAEVAADSSLQRYTIEEISAVVGLGIYMAQIYLDKARTAVINKEIVPICISLFALMFVFYIGLSFSDGLFLLTLIDAILLSPFILRQNLKGIVSGMARRVRSRASSRVSE
jgi:hypothetical protein